MPATACSRSLPRQGLHDAMEVWRLAAEGTVDYWSTAFERPDRVAYDAVPLLVGGRDAAQAGVVDAPRDRARVADRAPARLHAAPPTDVVPTLVLPPQAGHDSCIVDYSPDQSQMQTIRAAGLAAACYALDWVGATPGDEGRRRSTTTSTCIDAVGRARSAVGSTSSATARAAGWPRSTPRCTRSSVNTLTIAGAPIDFHAGEPVIHDWVEALATTTCDFYHGARRRRRRRAQGRVHARRLRRSSSRETELGKQLQLLAHLARRRATSSATAHFEDWFKHTQDIPGRLLPVDRRAPVPRQRAASRGELEIGGERVDLARIDCPLNLLAGAKDHITPPEQVFALADAVSTPPDQVRRRLSERRSPRPVHGPRGAARALAVRVLADHVPEHSSPAPPRPAPRR